LSDVNSPVARLANVVSRWRNEFPYHWDADDLVSRRELLNFTVYTSGALFAATALLTVLGLIERPAALPAQPIVPIDQIVAGKPIYFRYPGPDDEAVLLKLPNRGLVAYSQKCTHLSCAVYYQAVQARLFCPCHEGVFDPVTGDPVAGPPQRPLPRIILQQRGNLLYAVGRQP